MDVMMKAVPADMMQKAADIAVLVNERLEAGTWPRGNVMLSNVRVDETTVWRCRTSIGKTGRITVEGEGKVLDVPVSPPA